MTSRQFDIAIIGNSLSARIAATLLAKNGQRIILFGERTNPDPAWFLSSIFLEKLLGTLGGRACFTSPRPFQVLSSSSRLTIHGNMPLEEEFIREFGNDASEVIALLDHLRELGSSLNQLLWDNKGLPWPGIKSSAQFRYLCMRRKLSAGELEAPLQEKLRSFTAGPQEFLTNLFQGLSLLPIDQLTLADGALIWTHASRPENLAEPEFSNLLDKRFEQFHGVLENLEDLDKLDFEGSTFNGGLIRERGAFQAKWLLIGDTSINKSLLSAVQKFMPERSAVTTFTAGNLDGQVSPLLEEQVIIGGKHPLRINLVTSETEISCKVAAAGVLSELQLRQHLEAVLPFAAYDVKLQLEPDNRSTANQIKQTTSLFSLPIKMGSNVFCADSSALTPGLGAPGAALLGWTLANRLGPSQATT